MPTTKKSLITSVKRLALKIFIQHMEISTEQADDVLRQLQHKLERRQEFDLNDRMFFSKLQDYWEHQLKLLRGYEKDKNK